MKKRLLAVLLAGTLAIMSLSACGTSEENSKDSDITQELQPPSESQEASVESPTDPTDPQPGQSVTGEGIMVEGPGEDDGSIIEVEGEVTEIVDGEVVEIVEGEVVEIIEGEVTEIIETKDDDATGTTSDDGTDWSTAYDDYFIEEIETSTSEPYLPYDDYFTRDNIMPATPKITVTTVADGITFDMVVAMVEDVAYMSYDFGTVAMDMYVTTDKVYIRSEMEGQEAWNFAPITSEEEAQDMTVGIEDNTTLIDNDSIGTVTYREALEEDGVIYDVLDVTVDENSNMPGTAVYFINRETQMVAKCVMEQQGNTAICLVEEIESIELPAEAATATEVPMEDVLGAMLGVLFMGAGMGIDGE